MYVKRNGEFFFLDFVTQYFLDIFSEPPKSLFTNKFRICPIYDKTLQKKDLLYPFTKINGFKGQLDRSSFMGSVNFFLLDFVTFFFCIYIVIYLPDLSAGFIATKNHKTQILFFSFKKNLLYCLKNKLAGPVNLVKLACTTII